MGGYDAVCFYGIVYGGDGEGKGWGTGTLAALTHAGWRFQSFEFDKWLDGQLGISRPDHQYADYKRLREELQIERFGVLLSDVGWVGHLDYGAYIVYVKETKLSEYRHGAVPVEKIRDLELCAKYRKAMDELAKMLPGGGKPGWHFGCCLG